MTLVAALRLQGLQLAHAAAAPRALASWVERHEWTVMAFAVVAVVFFCAISPACREDVGTVVGGAIDGVEEAKWGLGGGVGSIGGVISHLIRTITKADDPAITDVGFPPAPPIPPGGNRPPPNRCIDPDDWATIVDVLWQAAKSKGYFGMGKASAATADIMGEAWVGPNWKLSDSGRAWESADGSRTYRPPSMKPGQGKVQANFERWDTGRTNPQNPNQPMKPGLIGNGHLDIDNACP